MAITKEFLLGQIASLEEQKQKAIIHLSTVDGGLQTAKHLLKRLESDEANALPVATVTDFPRPVDPPTLGEVVDMEDALVTG